MLEFGNVLFKGVYTGGQDHVFREIIPLIYCSWEEAVIYVVSVFFWSAEGEQMHVSGIVVLGDEVIGNIHCYKIMETLVEKDLISCYSL